MNQNEKPQPSSGGNPDQSVNSVPLYSKKRVAIPALAILSLVVVGVLFWRLTSAHSISTDDAYVDANRATISSKYSGKIARILAEEGDTVTMGQVLVRLDDSDLNAQEQQAKASFAYAQRNQELSKVNLEKAQEDFARAQVQYSSDIIPKEQFDHAKKELEAARAQDAIALSQIATARAQIGVIQTQQKNIIIAAPMNGVIAKKWAMPGDVVQVAQPILTIFDQAHPWITGNLEETKFGKLHLGQHATITIDTYGNRKFKGKIIQLGANTASQFSLIPPSNASGNFTKVTQRIPVKVALEQGTGTEGLVPGMSAEISIKVQ